MSMPKYTDTSSLEPAHVIMLLNVISYLVSMCIGSLNYFIKEIY